MSPPDEFELIRAWTGNRQSSAWLEAAGVAAGIGDDAAVVVTQPGRDLLLAMDTMVEETHFLPETMNDADIGYKALAANVSDIAAMGGTPAFALVSVSVPPAWEPPRMKAFYDGLYECAAQYGVAVVGGDTTVSPRHFVAAVTLAGTVETGRAIRRNGAKPGQFAFLTGTVGLSAGGLYGMLPASRAANVPAPPDRLVRAHRRPVPSVRAGRLLVERGWGQSLNDVSDGLASEAWEIAEASGVRLVLRENALPLSGELASYASECGKSALDWMLYGGEDYVLLGTADKRHEADMREAYRAEGIPFFVIGETEEGAPDVTLIQGDGKRKRVEKRGYNHFAKG